MNDQREVTVEPLSSSADVQAFLSFPATVYRDDANWVPPIWSEQIALLDRGRNPFFQNGEAEFLIARRNGNVVGTIGVGIDRRANARRGERAAFFTLFEAIPDGAVSHALLGEAKRWAEARGATVLRGPSDLSPARPGGLLVAGFTCPPVILTGHNPGYYPGMVERFGFQKWGSDHLAYRIDLAASDGRPLRPPAKLVRVAERVAARSKARIRSARLQEWSSELEVAREIYNESLASLPDFAPVSKEEFARQGEAMRAIVDPELVLFLEIVGRAVGLIIALPDINQALRHASGLRTPWDWARVWWHRRRIDCVSFKILALRPAYHGVGLDALLYRELATRVIQKGFAWMDLSVTGEDNLPVTRLVAMAGARIYKRYRTYELPLTEAKVEVTR